MSERIKEPKFTSYMKSLIIKLSSFKEEHIKMNSMLNKENYLIKLGFTDLSILEVGKKYDCLILTKDFPLYLIAIREGCKAYNFTHLIDL